MVHPSSTRISRVPAYLFVCLVLHQCFVYGTITLYRRPSQSVLLTCNDKSHQALPPSLAATKRISFDFFSFGYLDVSVPRVRLYNLCIQLQMTVSLQPGSPIRTSLDHRSFPASQRFSQDSTSFFASYCQGIHRLRFSSWPYNLNHLFAAAFSVTLRYVHSLAQSHTYVCSFARSWTCLD